MFKWRMMCLPLLMKVFFFKNVIVHLYPKHCSTQINSQCLEPGTPVQSLSDGLVAVFP